MRKRAVLIGCNYPGTKAELKGCINDVRRMQRCLLDRYGFPAENIVVLIDIEGSADAQPTGKNIRAALSDLAASSQPGDVLFVHYSGHGTRLPAETGDDDDTGYDECIVPTDMNLITDDDFREVVNKVAEGSRITIVSDSCHSGGLIEESKEQIGESTGRNRKKQQHKQKCSGLKSFLCTDVHQEAAAAAEHHTSKSLPLSTFIEILKQKTGKHDIDAGKLRPTLFDIFGNEANPKINKFMNEVMSKFVGRDGAAITDGGILISGCQSDETSADTSPEGDTTRAYGVLSNAIQVIISETDGRVSNRKLVVRARKLLKRQGFTQHPGLYCTDQNLHARFIC
ncbi:metacaspase-4-like [Salvia divinorum]|uniref:Metacaspase-4-like n=1 Tax=Salvia divinorum TaxID=28513 RepID=A0ABD1I6E0_SALDI